MKTLRFCITSAALLLSLTTSLFGQTNDFCTNATWLASGETNSVNTFDATEFGDPVFPCGFSVGRGVWYRITTPPNNVRLDVTTCGSDFLTTLAVFTNVCGSFSNVICADRVNP